MADKKKYPTGVIEGVGLDIHYNEEGALFSFNSPEMALLAGCSSRFFPHEKRQLTKRQQDELDRDRKRMIGEVLDYVKSKENEK